MPIYTFVNLKTLEERDETCTIAEMEEFLGTNPDWDVKPAAPFIGDPTRQGLKKPSDGFRDILRNVKKQYGGKKGSGKADGVNTF